MRAAVRTAGVCHVCGCTDARGCGPTGCGWTDATHTLCTACAAPRCARCATYAIDRVGADGAPAMIQHAMRRLYKGAVRSHTGKFLGELEATARGVGWVCPMCRPETKAVRT